MNWKVLKMTLSLSKINSPYVKEIYAIKMNKFATFSSFFDSNSQQNTFL